MSGTSRPIPRVTAPRITTLGPGTNHELVAQAYCAFHGLGDEHICFVDAPDEGVRQVLAGEADYLLLCSVHPDAARITALHFRRLFIVDTFISPSKTLAVLTRRGVAVPRSLAVFSPTRDYIDVSRWPELIVEDSGSILTVAARLLAGGCDSALVYLEYAERYPELFEVTEVIGSPDDAWLVFGATRAFGGTIIAHHGSVVGQRVAGLRGCARPIAVPITERMAGRETRPRRRSRSAASLQQTG